MTTKDQHPAEAPVAWEYAPNPDGWCGMSIPSENIVGMGDARNDNPYWNPLRPLYAHPDPEVTALRAEVAAYKRECELLTHKVITCGVAARHPDANLSRTGSYGGKWDSPQAQDVRALRDRADSDAATIARVRALADEFERKAAYWSSKVTEAKTDTDREYAQGRVNSMCEVESELRAALEGK